MTDNANNRGPAINQRLRPLIEGALVVIAIGIIIYGSISASEGTEPLPSTPTPDLSATAQAYQGAGDTEAAIEAWQATLTLDPQHAQAHYQLGLLLLPSDTEQAITHLEQAAEFNAGYNRNVSDIKDSLRLGAFSEDPAYGLVLLGQTLSSLGEWELAVKILTQATEANPNYAEAWAFLGEAQQQTGQDGLSTLETAIALDPDSYAANLLIAITLRRQSRPDEALVYLETMNTNTPNDPIILQEIANTLAEAGEFEAGLEYMQQIIDLSPNESVSWQALASYSLNHGIQVEEIGLPAARRAVIFDETDPVAITLLGQAYFIIGDGFNTEKFLTRALDNDPTYAPAHFYLGFFYLENGELEKGRQELNAAIQFATDRAIIDAAQDLLDRYFP